MAQLFLIQVFLALSRYVTRSVHPIFGEHISGKPYLIQKEVLVS